MPPQRLTQQRSQRAEQAAPRNRESPGAGQRAHPVHAAIVVVRECSGGRVGTPAPARLRECSLASRQSERSIGLVIGQGWDHMHGARMQHRAALAG